MTRRKQRLAGLFGLALGAGVGAVLVMADTTPPSVTDGVVATTTTEAAAPASKEPQVTSIGEPLTTKHVVYAGGLRRTFWVTTPPGADKGAKLPLIFVFHGRLESGKDIREYSRMDKAEAIVVYPDGQDTAWAPAPYAETTGEQDIAFVDAMREQISAEYNVDTARVFAAGLSNGGGFAAYLGCQRPQDFTAIATVSAAYYWKVSENCSDIPIKHIDIHGTADDVIEYNGGVRHDTEYDSVPSMLADMSRRNHCSNETTLTMISPGAVKSTWTDCDAPLEHIRVGAGGHVWPGGEILPEGVPRNDLATNEILEFWGIKYRTLRS